MTYDFLTNPQSISQILLEESQLQKKLWITLKRQIYSTETHYSSPSGSLVILAENNIIYAAIKAGVGLRLW